MFFDTLLKTVSFWNVKWELLKKKKQLDSIYSFHECCPCQKEIKSATLSLILRGIEVLTKWTICSRKRGSMNILHRD